MVNEEMVNQCSLLVNLVYKRIDWEYILEKKIRNNEFIKLFSYDLKNNGLIPKNEQNKNSS